MKQLLMLTTILLLCACNKDMDEEQMRNVPDCIQEILDEDQDLAIQKIRVQELNEELHYWLNTDFREVDGEEYIVNDACDTVCTIGGWFATECSTDYDSEAWEIIWEK